MRQAALNIDTCCLNRNSSTAILIVDKADDMPAEAIRHFREKGVSLEKVASREQALQCLAQRPYALAIIDSSADDREGMDLLENMRDQSPDLAVVITTATATVRHAVEAMQRGAVDYLMKPLGAEMLETCVLHLLNGKTQQPQLRLEAQSEDENPFITDSPAVKQILDTARAVAGSQATYPPASRNAAAAVTPSDGPQIVGSQAANIVPRTHDVYISDAQVPYFSFRA